MSTGGITPSGVLSTHLGQIEKMFSQNLDSPTSFYGFSTPKQTSNLGARQKLSKNFPGPNMATHEQSIFMDMCTRLDKLEKNYCASLEWNHQMEMNATKSASTIVQLQHELQATQNLVTMLQLDVMKLCSRNPQNPLVPRSVLSPIDFVQSKATTIFPSTSVNPAFTQIPTVLPKNRDDGFKILNTKRNKSLNSRNIMNLNQNRKGTNPMMPVHSERAIGVHPKVYAETTARNKKPENSSGIPAHPVTYAEATAKNMDVPNSHTAKKLITPNHDPTVANVLKKKHNTSFTGTGSSSESRFSSSAPFIDFYTYHWAPSTNPAMVLAYLSERGASGILGVREVPFPASRPWKGFMVRIADDTETDLLCSHMWPKGVSCVVSYNSSIKRPCQIPIQGNFIVTSSPPLAANDSIHLIVSECASNTSVDNIKDLLQHLNVTFENVEQLSATEEWRCAPSFHLISHREFLPILLDSSSWPVGVHIQFLRNPSSFLKSRIPVA